MNWWETLPVYQINTGVAVIMAIALTGLFALMALLNPQTRLNRLAMWFAFCCMMLVWRTVASLMKPEIFGVRENLFSSFVWMITTIVTVMFGATAWYEYVGDMRDHRRSKKRGWRK